MTNTSTATAGRCTEPGCPVRFSSGTSRPCPDHRPPEAAHGYHWSGDPGEADNDAERDAPQPQRAPERRAETTERQRAAAAAAKRDRFSARRRADRAAEAEPRRAAAERAAAWLLAYLLAAGGRASHRAIVIAAADAGHPSAACRSAQRMLALTSVRCWADDRSYTDWVGYTDWALPGVAAADQDAQQRADRLEADRAAQQRADRAAERLEADPDAQQRADRAAELLRTRVEQRAAIQQRCADAAAERRNARLTGPVPAVTG